MLTVTGIGVIDPDPQQPVNETQVKTTYIFSFRLICKDPYKELRNYYQCSVAVPAEFVDKARSQLTQGKVIQIRLGELKGTKFPSGKTFASIQTKWKWIECLSRMPSGDRDTYKDV